MPKVEPGRFSMAWVTLANVWRGWKPPVCAPACLAGSSEPSESAPLQWTTLWPGCQTNSAATCAMASSGVVMKTRSAASATACFVSCDVQPGTVAASLSADDLLRLAAATTR